MAEKYDITFGADPEFFITDKKGHIIPSCGLIGGDKGKAVELELGGYLEDNVTVELNPKQCGTGTALSKTMRLLKAQFTDAKGYAFSSNNEYQFKAEELVHPKAQAFGCDPDWDAYDNSPRARVNPEVVGNWRFCGGHIHIGINPWPNIPKNIFIQFLDLFAYSEYVAYDRAHMRRPFYGLAGLFRPKSYGVEYRTPSNFWCTEEGQRLGYHNFPQMIERVVRQLVYQAETDRNVLTNMYRSIDWAEVRQKISMGAQPDAYSNFYNEFGHISQYKSLASTPTIDELLRDNRNQLDRLQRAYVMPRFAEVNEEEAAARRRRARMLQDPEYMRLQDVYNTSDDAISDAQRRYDRYEAAINDGEEGYTNDGLDELHLLLEDARLANSEAAQEWSDYEDNWQDPGDPVIEDLIDRILAPEVAVAQGQQVQQQANLQNAQLYFNMLGNQAGGGGGRIA